MFLPPLAVAACLALLAPFGVTMDQEFQIPFEKHVLDNGLQVVIHEDHSDPVVAVYIVYHVGSGREEVGRSGFAHLFEHLMFQGSENVGDDQHFKLVSEAGGTLNGSTNRDRTNYYETMPSNQLELALWLEADRMGFLLPAITPEKLDNQREVVKNERRQNYENRPYAQARGAIMESLYPADHSYNWTTIGSHEDLTAASLEDVINFFQRWYGPNNATLAIGGDVDPEQALELAKRYFGGIPRGAEVAAPVVRSAHLQQDVRLAMEDKVQRPQLTVTWPGVEMAHQDAAALSMLAQVLSANKAALLDKALSIDETLVDYVTAYHLAAEQAGEFAISVRPVGGVSLDELENRIRSILEELAINGVEQERLDRLKARYEASTINRFETASSRTSALCEANTFFGDPAEATRNLREMLAVTPSDVVRVLKRYVLDKPAVLMSVVPEGRLGMVARGRTAEQVVVEETFDRSRQPQPSPSAEFKAPSIWHDTLANGVPVVGTEYHEIPIVSIELSVPGGHLRESMYSLGVSSLTAELMGEGTEDLDAVGLTNALDAIGASLSVSSSSDEITISLRTLTKHLDAAVALLCDVLLKPRFAQEDFDRLKTQRLTALESRGDNINAIAGNVWNRIMYGEDSIAGTPSSGTLETIDRMNIGQVVEFYFQAVVPDQSRLVVVGDVEPERIRELFKPLADGRWLEKPALALNVSPQPSVAETRVFLVDKSGAPQSQVRVGHPGLSALDEDYYPFSIMNYALGGSFSSRINMNLREDKGYTYGARSSMRAGLRPGVFTASSGVRTDVTKESLAELMGELEAIQNGLTNEEAAFAKDAMQQAMNRQYESVRALRGVVDNVSKYGYADDYIDQRRELLGAISKDDLDALAQKYIHPESMTMLIVGDKETVGDRLAELGYGEPIELDIDGNLVDVQS